MQNSFTIGPSGVYKYNQMEQPIDLPSAQRAIPKRPKWMALYSVTFEQHSGRLNIV